MSTDILVSCLKLLSFDDFLSAAASNQRLNTAANLIYAERYKSQKVYFRMQDERDTAQKRSENLSDITDLRSCFK